MRTKSKLPEAVVAQGSFPSNRDSPLFIHSNTCVQARARFPLLYHCMYTLHYSCFQISITTLPPNLDRSIYRSKPVLLLQQRLPPAAPRGPHGSRPPHTGGTTPTSAAAAAPALAPIVAAIEAVDVEERGPDYHDGEEDAELFLMG